MSCGEAEQAYSHKGKEPFHRKPSQRFARIIQVAPIVGALIHFSLEVCNCLAKTYDCTIQATPNRPRQSWIMGIHEGSCGFRKFGLKDPETKNTAADAATARRTCRRPRLMMGSFRSVQGRGQPNPAKYPVLPRPLRLPGKSTTLNLPSLISDAWNLRSTSQPNCCMPRTGIGRMLRQRLGKIYSVARKVECRSMHPFLHRAVRK